MVQPQTITQPYAVQHVSTCEDIQTFLRGSRRTVELPVKADMLAEGRIKHSDKGVLVSFTRKQVIDGLTLATNHAIEHGPNSCSNLPNAGKAISVINALAVKHTVSRGVNKNQVRIALLQGLAAHNRVLKGAKIAEERNEAVQAGTDWYADGVTNRDGELIVYTSENAACKAHARTTHGAAMAELKEAHAEMTPAQRRKNPLVITDWWADATVKADLLKNAVVSQDAMDFYEAPLPSMSDMSPAKIIGMAKGAGAPSKVVTGTGAGNRSRTYLLDNNLAVI